jgi:hypothetical protein
MPTINLCKLTNKYFVVLTFLYFVIYSEEKWSNIVDNISAKKYKDLSYAVGRVLAPFYGYTAHWVQDKAQLPIKIALRDGEPILEAAKIINQKDKNLDCSNWKPVWLNSSVVIDYCKPENKRQPYVSEYFNQESLDKPFTLVDTGYNGSMPFRLWKYKHINTQSLFIALNPNSPYLRNSAPGGIAAFMSEKCCKEKFWDHNDIVFCAHICESLPKKYSKFNMAESCAFVLKDGSYQPVIKKQSPLMQDCYHAFADGMKDRLDAFPHHDTDKKGKYFACLAKNTSTVSESLSLAHKEYREYGMYLPGFIEKLNETNKEITEIYRQEPAM